MNIEATIGPENRGPGESGGNGRPPPVRGLEFLVHLPFCPILVARGSLRPWCDYKVSQTLEGYWGF